MKVGEAPNVKVGEAPKVKVLGVVLGEAPRVESGEAPNVKVGKDAPTPKVRRDDEVEWASCWASTAVRPDALDGLSAVLGVFRAGRTPRVAMGLAFSDS